MGLTREEQEELEQMLEELCSSPKVQQMKQYIQHGSITTYDHCRGVARLCFLMERRFHTGCDEQALVKGAMLHDFYLYDWHQDDHGAHRLHGFTHPEQAARNADLYFNVSEKELQIIRSHMWPLTIRALPECREAVLVCIADKCCSLYETMFRRK